MIFLLLSFFVLAAYSAELNRHAFHYKDGTISIGTNPEEKLTGSVYHKKESNYQVVYFVGMNYATMTPFMVAGLDRSGNYDTAFKTYDCHVARWASKDAVNFTGSIKLTGTWASAKVKGTCINDKETWNFNADGMESRKLFYRDEEAGLRARALLGRSTKDFGASNVVMYAMLDYPHFSSNCRTYFGPEFPDLIYPQPGAIVLGKDGAHCGIIDDKGSKFVHSHPSKEKVADESLAMLGKYFPNGVVYKGYPDDIRLPLIEHAN
eukprot:TRINITY_DN2797_c0_g1_i5.p1 TRINITY_DN2797_c0_g1~~TRINITY_DN2797_c0_g1_i5.p1  ORF type:complete len:264 (-),score=46.50 TRINITY_DN2797_c0_g1_i5:111-902(-)